MQFNNGIEFILTHLKLITFNSKFKNLLKLYLLIKWRVKIKYDQDEVWWMKLRFNLQFFIKRLR